MPFSMRFLLVLLVASAVLAGSVAAAPGPESGPSVRLARMSPVVVAGTGFGRDTSVRVSVRSGAKTVAKMVRSTSTGAIKATFSQSLTMYACRGTTITAAARNGLNATWRPNAKSCLAIAVPIASTG